MENIPLDPMTRDLLKEVLTGKKIGYEIVAADVKTSVPIYHFQDMGHPFDPDPGYAYYQLSSHEAQLRLQCLDFDDDC